MEFGLHLINDDSEENPWLEAWHTALKGAGSPSEITVVPHRTCLRTVRSLLNSGPTCVQYFKETSAPGGMLRERRNRGQKRVNAAIGY